MLLIKPATRCAGCGIDGNRAKLHVSVARFATCGKTCSDKVHGVSRQRVQRSSVSRMIARYEQETGVSVE